MRITTVREFQVNLTRLLRTEEPILVFRHRKLAAVVFPQPDKTLGLEMAEELSRGLDAELRRRAERAVRGKKPTDGASARRTKPRPDAD